MENKHIGKIIFFLCISYICLFVIDLVYVWLSKAGTLLMCGYFFIHICLNAETLYHLALLVLAIIIPLSYYILTKKSKGDKK